MSAMPIEQLSFSDRHQCLFIGFIEQLSVPDRATS